MMSEEQGIGSLKLTGSCVDSTGALLVNGFAGSAFNGSMRRKSLGSIAGNISNIMGSSVLLPNLSHLNDQQNLYMNINNNDEQNGANLPWNEEDDYYPPNNNEDFNDELNLDHLYEKNNENILQTPLKRNLTNENKNKNFKRYPNSNLLDPHMVISEPKPIKKGRPYRLPPLLVLKDKIIKYNNTSTKKLFFPSVFDIFLTHYEKKFSQYWKEIVLLKNINHEEEDEIEGKKDILLSNYNVPLRGLYDVSLIPLLKLKQKLYKKKKLQENKSKKVNKLLYDEGDNDIISNILYNSKKKKLNPMKSNVMGSSLEGEEDNNNQEMMMLYGDDYIDNEFYKEDEDKKNAKENEQKKINPDEILFNQYIHKNNELNESKNGDNNPTDFIEDYFGDDINYDNDYDEELALRMNKALNEDLLRASAHTYEMICKQYIESFHRGANAYAM